MPLDYCHPTCAAPEASAARVVRVEPDDGPRARCRGAPRQDLDRKHDIPYLAGYSNDGKIIYIDRHMPRIDDASRPRDRDRSVSDPARGGREDADRPARPALSARPSDRHAGRAGGGARRRHPLARLRPLHAETRQDRSATSGCARFPPISISSPIATSTISICSAHARCIARGREGAGRPKVHCDLERATDQLRRLDRTRPPSESSACRQRWRPIAKRRVGARPHYGIRTTILPMRLAGLDRLVRGDDVVEVEGLRHVVDELAAARACRVISAVARARAAPAASGRPGRTSARCCSAAGTGTGSRPPVRRCRRSPPRRWAPARWAAAAALAARSTSITASTPRLPVIAMTRSPTFSRL